MTPLVSVLITHPLRDSSIYDTGAANHVINNRQLLVPGTCKDFPYDDYLLVGDSLIKVVGRGKRIIKNALNGPDGLYTRDLVLYDVAFIPNFYINVISGYSIKKLGYWIYEKDNSLRWGEIDNSVIILNFLDKYGLLVVKYKPINRSYLHLPHSTAYIFSTFRIGDAR